MTNKANFVQLTELAMQGTGHAHMRPVIEKELLHYDILFCLDANGLLDQLTFQGGTSLRLCYGAPRFSEDLDFSGGVDFNSKQLQAMKTCLERYIGDRYGFEVSVKEPAELKDEPEYAGLNVDKWQVSITTAPERRDLPRQRIKIEVANIPSYSREPKALLANYEFLPDGYSDTLVLAESLDEIMADKLVSLVNTQRYVRNRDIWDLRWLKQQGAIVRMGWIKNKVSDYSVEDYSGKVATMLARLPDIIKGDAFRNEMARFIPQDVQERTLHKEKFFIFLTAEITGLLQQVQLGFH
ncbi:nucleotidyl transferase AbiEii/AbiGii toxin family protein [Lelliottia sp. V106_10]|uniref:nucleotidyl transferase AbiEii/AbiGii toxin family protein n=1 Tax=Lelliottia wanjuensis TaxID=3050585 RepID=UPI00254B0271|nr:MULTISPECIES: nucleotidyl transferase AbiEii/AbiGii toxin family protein [unclassified Lelliottia]MDK9357993.1 nucleotidyl transferase AbiEii/AbiGii toxin family protein [Lelliottia sp. V106_16]MDK9374983.1 nucleotidyl transferase AbiEii/AbiGii toxin family protein [Lelliottia sp. V106_10]MDK9600630.1 nucleotidyl transferase AbiEii/AbiGii toxin family protein [Lelliottia sp. V106_5]